MNTDLHPLQVKIYAVLLLASAIVMAAIGWSANAYYISAFMLALQTLLLWRGRGFAAFKWILLVNQIGGIVLILVLWLGDGLGDAKLDIAGVALMANVFTGGPLMSILAAALVPSLHHGRRLFNWFHPQTA